MKDYFVLYAKQSKSGSESGVSCFKQGREMSNFCLKLGRGLTTSAGDSSTQTSLDCSPHPPPPGGRQAYRSTYRPAYRSAYRSAYRRSYLYIQETIFIGKFCQSIFYYFYLFDFFLNNNFAHFYHLGLRCLHYSQSALLVLCP